MNAGTLSVTGSLTATSAVSVASRATLGGLGSRVRRRHGIPGGTITGGAAGTGSLTLNGGLTFGGTGTVNVSTIANYTTNAAVNVTQTNGLTTAGTVTLMLTGAAPVGTGTAHLIEYAGTVQGTGLSSFVLNTSGITGLGARATLTLDTSVANFVNVNYSVDHPVWTGALNGLWSTATQSAPKNWVLASNSATTTDFISGDAVVFDDTATGTTTVTLNGSDVTPGSVQFNNSAKNYTLNGTNAITARRTSA